MGHAGKGDHDRAVADASTAIRLDPSTHLAYHVRGTSYAKKGLHDAAIADFSELIRRHPDAEAYTERECAYIAKGEYAPAIADFSAAILHFGPYRTPRFCHGGTLSCEPRKLGPFPPGAGGWWASACQPRAGKDTLPEPAS